MGGTFQLYIRFPYISSGSPLQSGSPLLDVSMREYFEALSTEVGLRAAEQKWVSKSLHSIHVGGSAVWIYYPELMSRFVEKVCDSFKVATNVTIFLRMDPAHVTSANLRRLNFATNTKLTLRALSFDPRQGKGFNSHCLNSNRVFELLQDRYGNNFGLDYMFGNPSQSREEFAEETKRIVFSGSSLIRLRPRLLRRSGNLKSETSQGIFAKKTTLRRALDCIGYMRKAPEMYTLTEENDPFLKLGLYASVLGIGAGARTRYLSQDGSAFRYQNAGSARMHGERLFSSGRSEFYRESLSQVDQYHDWIALSLRLRGSVPLDGIEQRFGVNLNLSHPGVFEVLTDLGYGQIEDREFERSFQISEEGHARVDEVISLLKVTEEELELGEQPSDSRDAKSKWPSLRLPAQRRNPPNQGFALPHGVAVAGPFGSK